MKFKTVDDAQRWSTQNGEHVYVQIEGADGVLEVYPGGRKAYVSADKGKIYQRWLKRLTPDEAFRLIEREEKQ